MNTGKMKIYVSPSAKRGTGYPNAYFIQLKKGLESHFDVLEADNRPCLMQGTAMLRNAFKADVFLLSFVETMAFQKLALLQSMMALLALRIMHSRRRKIVFIFHNIHPHKGENFLSRLLTGVLMKRSHLILSHSEAAAAYARDYLQARGLDPGKAVFRPHPLRLDLSNIPDRQDGDGAPVRDVLIWGDILPYKGVAEFLSKESVRNSGLRISVVGRCKDGTLASKIEEAIGLFPQGRAEFRNERPGFDEIASLVRGSRHILFPYLPGSISSSGALMDTIAMGGTPVGPDAGAFRDLAADNLCLIYHDDDEMLDILKSGKTADPSVAREFLYSNSWPAFVSFLRDAVSAL